MPSAAVVVSILVVAAGWCVFNPCCRATPVGAPPPNNHQQQQKYPHHSFLTLVRAASALHNPLSSSPHLHPFQDLSSSSSSSSSKSGPLSLTGVSGSGRQPHQSYSLAHRGRLPPSSFDFSPPLLQRHHGVGMGEPDAGGGNRQLLSGIEQEDRILRQQQEEEMSQRHLQQQNREPPSLGGPRNQQEEEEQHLQDGSYVSSSSGFQDPSRVSSWSRKQHLLDDTPQEDGYITSSSGFQEPSRMSSWSRGGTFSGIKPLEHEESQPDGGFQTSSSGDDSRASWSKRGGGSSGKSPSGGGVLESVDSLPAPLPEEGEDGAGLHGHPEVVADGLQQVSASLASSFLRHARSGARNYDIPQIECPPAEDQMERFPCPSPDRMGRYRCIDDHVLCDGFIDCPNAEDEEMQQCMFYKTTKAHLDVIADAIIRFIRGRK